MMYSSGIRQSMEPPGDTVVALEYQGNHKEIL